MTYRIDLRRAGTIDLPLHGGSCPPWLFSRMRKFAAAVTAIIVDDYGTDELIKRLSNPLFFQALNCASAMDWHSSGSTTTLTAAIKLALMDSHLGIIGCGGKGRTSRKTPSEIEEYCGHFNISDSKRAALLEATKMVAKIDSSCVQDGFDLYHHSFFFNEKGNWSVIQQGMCESNGYARRYHWMQTNNFVDGPPEKIAGERNVKNILNLVSINTPNARRLSVDLIRDNPKKLQKYFTGQLTLLEGQHFKMPKRHELLKCGLRRKDWEILEQAYELQPENYKELVSLRGMGKKKLRALALVSRLIYGAELDYSDPALYAFAHGGKDGWPYMADRGNYDHTISFLRDAIDGSELESTEKKRALKRLAALS